MGRHSENVSLAEGMEQLKVRTSSDSMVIGHGDRRPLPRTIYLPEAGGIDAG